MIRGDIQFGRIYANIELQWSKTRQDGGQLLHFPLPRMPGSKLCLVTALENLFRLIAAAPEDHCFIMPDGSSYTYRQFQKMLKTTLHNAGYDETLFSSHSLCQGGPTWAFLLGVPTEMIKALREWKSNSYLKYIHFPVEARVAACQLVCMRLNWLGF